ncbi:MAG TPA: hypothetical protein VOA80_18425 [Thermoanaerobaculia bacterium]|nr:hypothetical protein [Thermoanaerobaculia bacterium]
MTTAAATGAAATAAAAAGVRRQGYRRLLGFGLVLFGAAWGLPAPGAVRAALAQPAVTATAAEASAAAASTTTESAGAGPEEAEQPLPPAPRRFKLGVELDANLRHSDDTRVASRYPYLQAQETVDPGSHAEISNVALLADYDPSPLWRAHLRFNGVNLYYRNPTSTDHPYDLAELWVRFGRETGPAIVPERPGMYVKLGKFARPEREEQRHLQSYGLVGTAFDLFEDAGLEVGADLGRHFFVKAALTQGNPLFIRDTNALAGDTPDLLAQDAEYRAKLNGGLPILYDTHVEHLDFAHPEAAGYLGWRLGDPGGASGLELMAWGRRRRLAASYDLPGSPLGGDLATFTPLGTPILPFHGNGKQEVGADLRIFHASGLSLFAAVVDQLVAGLGRTGIEAEAAWKIDLPLAWAAGGRQLFSFIAPAVRYSKLHNRFYNLAPTPEPSLAWDWEKLDGGIRIGLWGGIDLTAEYSYNRTFLNPHLTENENEFLGTLRIRL